MQAVAARGAEGRRGAQVIAGARQGGRKGRRPRPLCRARCPFVARRVVPARQRARRARSSARCTSGSATIVASARSRTCPFLHVHSHLSAADDAILWQLRAPRVVLGVLVGGMLALAGGVVPGRLPQPARRPVPARDRRRRRPRRDDRDRLRAAARSRAYDLRPARRVRRRRVRRRRHLRARPLGRRRPQPGDADPRRRHGDELPHRRCRPSSSSSTPTRCRRSTAGSSAGSTPRAGTRSRSSRRTSASASIVILLHRRVLDVLSVGDEEAASLGINVRRTRLADRRRSRRSARPRPSPSAG